MNPTPSPIDVIVHASPAADWQVWAAFAPLIAAVVAGLIAGAALWQKRRADNRSEWWRRAQWALNASLSKNPSEAEMGQKAIDLLGRSKLATTEELALLRTGTEDPLEAADQARRAEAGDHAGISDSIQVDRATVDAGGNPGDNGGDNDDDTDR